MHLWQSGELVGLHGIMTAAACLVNADIVASQAAMVLQLLIVHHWRLAKLCPLCSEQWLAASS